jgi:hypothetical protein
MLGLLASAVAVHVVPNVAMKVVKSTKKGHDFLTFTFDAGVELGRKGKKLGFTISDFMTYGFGPESMIEYSAGLKFGLRLQDMTEEEQEVAIAEFKLEILKNFSDLTKEEMEDLKKTPFLNTLYNYAKGKTNKKLVNYLTNFSVSAEKKRTVKNLFIGATALTTVATIDLHTLLQPAICQIRKTIGTSKMGKEVLSNNFDKGTEGVLPNKFTRGIVDLTIAPSVLDTMRVGYSFHMKGEGEKARELKKFAMNLL